MENWSINKTFLPELKKIRKNNKRVKRTQPTISRISDGARRATSVRISKDEKDFILKYFDNITQFISYSVYLLKYTSDIYEEIQTK